MNGAHRDVETALGKLVHDIFCEKPDEMYYASLAKKVRYFKEDEKGIETMSEVMEKLLKEQQKSIAQKMLELGKMALSEIAEYTGLSISTVRRMAKKLDIAQA